MSNKIVFFGSGPVAAESLRCLISDFEIEAVITKPSTKKQMSEIAGNAPVYVVSNKTDLDGLIKATFFESKLAILIDFGIIVSKDVIDSFKKGIVNSHFSLLPEWRGADPITFSILSGQKKTGVSLMLLAEGMDTGKILVQKSLEINAGDTGTTLTARLIALSDQLLKDNVEKYLVGNIKPRQQPHPNRATYSRKLTKEDGILDFTKPAEVLEREIRAFQEWPKSRTTLANKDVVILKASVGSSTSGKPGEVYTTHDKKIGICTNSGSLVIEVLKPAGKRAMPADAFIAGYGNKL